MQGELVRKSRSGPGSLLSKALASQRFLLWIVLIYTLSGLLWVWFTDRGPFPWLFLRGDLILVLVSGFILALSLGAHARAVYLTEQALINSLAMQETASSIDAELIAEQKLERVLTAVCAGAVNLGHQLCWVGLVKDDGRIELIASHGFALEYLKDLKVRWDETPLGMGPAGRAARLGKTCVFQDILNHPDFAPWREAAMKHGYKAVAGIPIFGRDKVLGVVTIYNQRRNSFSQTDLFRLELLAQKASMAILVSGQREALEKLSRQHELLLDSVQEGIYGVDLEGRLTFINQAAARMLGFDRTELLGKKIHSIIHHTRDNQRPYDPNECPLHQAVELGAPFTSQEELLWRKDGTPLPVELSATPLREGEDVVGAVMVFRDLTEIKHIKEQIANLSNYELVTGVYNRRRFTEELNRALLQAKHFGTPGALLLLEVDSYKAINSTLGRTAADKLLIDLAKLIQRRLKETDIIGNLGGAEFGIILQGLTGEQVEAWAERLLASIRKHDFKTEHGYLNITATVGITFFEPEVRNADQLLIQGEYALFQAREKGYNRTQVYDSRGLDPAEAPWGWEYRLRRALEKEQFILQFQPVVDLETFRVTGYEALLRLVDDDGQVIQPGVFLPWAERYGLIVEIDRWVLRKALEYLKIAEKKGMKDLLLGINISGHTLADPEFREILLEEWAGGRAYAEALVLEITETAAVANLAEARGFVNSVRKLGPRFSLDDFGSGFSSLSYLKHLPVEFLKIDGNFIWDIASNPVDQELVKFMVQVAKLLNKKTVAEFVEDEYTAQLLREYGVDYAQGYYFGRPGDYI